MNVQRAERMIQLLAPLAAWLAFVVVWVSGPRHLETWLGRGADLPGPTLAWLTFAGSWMSLLVPALCTAAMIWVLRKRMAHANWVASAVLLTALLYTIIALTALILPSFTLCGPVGGV